LWVASVSPVLLDVGDRCRAVTYALFFPFTLPRSMVARCSDPSALTFGLPPLRRPGGVEVCCPLFSFPPAFLLGRNGTSEGAAGGCACLLVFEVRSHKPRSLPVNFRGCGDSMLIPRHQGGAAWRARLTVFFRLTLITRRLPSHSRWYEPFRNPQSVPAWKASYDLGHSARIIFFRMIAPWTFLALEMLNEGREVLRREPAFSLFLFRSENFFWTAGFEWVPCRGLLQVNLIAGSRACGAFSAPSGGVFCPPLFLD